MGRAGHDDGWITSAGVTAGDRALVVGPVPGELHDVLRREGLHVAELGWADAWTVQYPDRASLAVVPTDLSAHALQAAMHAALVHLDIAGCLLLLGDGTHTVPGMELVAAVDGWALWRRGGRRTVHDLVAAARHTVTRHEPHDLHQRLRAGEPITVVDTRTPTDRDRFGTIAGSLHVPRTVLEFHLDPANGYLHPAAPGFADQVVVVCNGGYSSSLAAANLAAIGFRRVGDLVGGITAWAAAGLPLVPPDHCHLELPHALHALPSRH